MAAGNRTSDTIYADNTTLISAQVTVTGSGSSLDFYLGVSDTIDGTYTYELISDISGGTHTFTASGKFLKWRGIGTSYTITQIKIKVNT